MFILNMGAYAMLGKQEAQNKKWLLDQAVVEKLLLPLQSWVRLEMNLNPLQLSGLTRNF